jgi:hypothetical protein
MERGENEMRETGDNIETPQDADYYIYWDEI